MAPHRKRKYIRNLSIADIAGSILSYVALAFALGALMAPMVGAYFGDTMSLIGAAIVSSACGLIAVLLALAYRNWIVPGFTNIRVGDLVKLALVVLLPAVWTLCLLWMLAADEFLD